MNALPIVIAAVILNSGWAEEINCVKCFRPNEVYGKKQCETECSNLTMACPFEAECSGSDENNGCYCKNGYARDESTACVPTDECNNRINKICGQNEEYRCENACNAECLKPNGTCPLKKCVDGCYCIENYSRNTNGFCVLTETCNTCRKV